jgi:hypothetical protein
LAAVTGLSSGACQEAFHSWAENYAVGFGECLWAASRRGIYHLASQAIKVVAPLAVLACLLSPVWSGPLRVFGIVAFGSSAVVISLFTHTLQPSFAAGKPRFWRAVQYAFQASGRHFRRSLLVTSVRALLLIFAVFNLHLFWSFALWVAENLAGFDVAYLGVLCSLRNGAYFLTLVLLAWCLLSPYHEAVGYLFFVDARTRREGLDLWHRVQDLFSTTAKRPAGPMPGAKPATSSPAADESTQGATNWLAPAKLGSAVLGCLLLVVAFTSFVSAAQAGDKPLEAVQDGRRKITVIRAEMEEAQPFPGSVNWLPQLEKTADSLEASVTKPEGYRWFRAAIQDFAGLEKREAVIVLDELDERLALVEESLARPRQVAPADAAGRDYIRGLIPPEKRPGQKTKTKEVEDKVENKNEPPPVEEAEREGGNFAKPAGPGIVSSLGIDGAAYVLLVFLVVLGVAALIAGLAYVAFAWWRSREENKPRQAGSLAARQDDVLEDPAKQDPGRLWRQADERARAGDHLGAVRILYLAVLAMLHQGGFIRYERTRTNGEYADQLRRRAPLQRPLLRLTGLFELKWYGQRACEAEDYHRCRDLAEEIRLDATPA